MNNSHKQRETNHSTEIDRGLFPAWSSRHVRGEEEYSVDTSTENWEKVVITFSLSRDSHRTVKELVPSRMGIPDQLQLIDENRRILCSANAGGKENISSNDQILFSLSLHVVDDASLAVAGSVNASG